MTKLSLMHKLYSKNPAQVCGTCSNFVSGRRHGRILRKCSRYGLTHSEASDWAGSWRACGMYCVPLLPGERPVIEWKVPQKAETGPVDGQITMGAIDE